MREFLRWLFTNKRCPICGCAFTWKEWKKRQIGESGWVAHDPESRCNEWID